MSSKQTKKIINLRAKFISLRGRPVDVAQATVISNAIGSTITTRRLEGGPLGGTPIYAGDALAGELIDAPIDAHENGWNVARILDMSVAQAAHSLENGEFWPPAEPKSQELPMTRLGQIGHRGVHHWQLIDPAMKGAFIKSPPSRTATYPGLWNHNATSETRLVCQPDSQMYVRPGMEDDAARLWATASRAHLNLDFRFNSQPLLSAFTEQVSLGGRAWPNVRFSDERFDYAFSVWANGTLGLLSFWWRSNRQVAGRGITTISAIDSLPVLDFRALTDEQLRKAETIFNEFRDKDLKPAYLADADPNRALLDRRVVCDLLGFDEETYVGVRRLAAKWCAEPSVHGGKARPEGAALVV